MKMNQKVMNVIKTAGKVTAENGGYTPCSWFWGQPKMPKTLANKIATKYNK